MGSRTPREPDTRRLRGSRRRRRSSSPTRGPTARQDPKSPGSCATLPLDEESHQEAGAEGDQHADERVLTDLLACQVCGLLCFVLTLLRLVRDDILQGTSEFADIGA